MRRIKIVFASTVALILPVASLAESPQNLDEVLFGLSGCTDYLQWVRSVGVVKFRTPIAIFKEAEFSSRAYYVGWEPSHCRIVMRADFFGSECFTNVVRSIKGVENKFSEEFVGIKFERREGTNCYYSVCTNIDGCGWTASFSVRQSISKPKATPSWEAKGDFRRDVIITNFCVDIVVEQEAIVNPE